MSKTVIDKPLRGGKREGAGRKKMPDGERRTPVRTYVPPYLHDEFKTMCKEWIKLKTN